MVNQSLAARSRSLSFCLPVPAMLSLWVALLPAASADDIGITVPQGFRVELFADDDLAHDIHSLTTDSRGRIVVSGPGYVRTLLDINGDGKADRYREFADRPKTGAQGMYFLGPHLLCSGDDGLQIFRDDNRDGRADGDPEVFLRIQAGGEHHVHSIQKGPDGWWYIIAGNMSGVTSSYATLPTSPLKLPYAGTLLRLKPDLFGGEVLADGFRNAYDFAFSISGDIFTYDSDGERDVSLPWYEPTRVFQVTPRSNAGWVTRSWKRPERFFDMPPVVASFGRGSPTGVICYRHTQFPGTYYGALFVQDWTFGRIMALPLKPDGSVWDSEPIEFAAGSGQFGFAPTDMEVAPDGSLYVSVGGRGTRGGVYRIVYEANENQETLLSQTVATNDPERLDRVLTAPQPASSWSRAVWVPLAETLGADVFADAAVDEGRRPDQRVRAVEILTELFRGPGEATLTKLSKAKSSQVRARAAWGIGRKNPASPGVAMLLPFLGDREPQVVRAALEALVTASGSEVLEKALPRIAAALGSSDRFVRYSAGSLMEQLSETQTAKLAALLDGNPRALVAMSLGMHLRPTSLDLDAVELAMTVLADSAQPADLRADAARLLELGLGDVGPKLGRDAVFDSYAPQLSLDEFDLKLNPVRTSIAAVFPSGNDELDHELIRIIAMLAPLNRDLIDPLLAGITADSAPTADIHRLAALARIAVDRTYEQTVATAAGLVNLDVKIEQRNLKQDSNWNDRIGELYKALIAVDPAIPQVIVDQPGLGLPGHVLLTNEISQEKVPAAINAFVTRIAADENYKWSNEVVFLIGESTNPAHQKLLREQLDNLSVRDAVLMVIAEKPDAADRQLFVDGLASGQINAVEACLKALKALPASADAGEQFALLSAARRLMNDSREYELREQAVRLLQVNTGEDFAFEFGDDGHKPQPEPLAACDAFLRQQFPDYHPADAGEDAAKTLEMLDTVAWERGNKKHGEQLFAKLSCSRCHGGRQALGPDLQGVARRFSRNDLFAAVVEPNRDVSSRYQTTSIETTSGKIYAGLIVYESVDGLLLRDAAHNTYRIEAHEIEGRQQQRTSLMPAGLLKDVSAQDLADLYAYLREL
ncbi:MAG: HEAT repeat domain-containing protein [Planctomycetaceae bacterium]